MSILNAIAQGFNPGAGKLAGAQNAYAIKRDEEQERYNRSRDAKADQQNAMTRQDAKDAQAAQWFQGIVGQSAAIKDPGQRVQWIQSMVETSEFETPPPDQMAKLLQAAALQPGPAPELMKGPGGKMVQKVEGAQSYMPPDPLAEYTAKKEIDSKIKTRDEAAQRALPPTPLDAAKLRKEVAQAQVAETKLAADLKEAAAGRKTAEQLVTIAKSLLSEDMKKLAGQGEYDPPIDVESVFGSTQGRWFMPNLYQNTIDAEAKVEQLTSLLTLENMDKMAGVLSDNDMIVLRSAASVLSNRTISDEMALFEIQELAKGFEGEGGQSIGRFIVTEKKPDAQ